MDAYTKLPLREWLELGQAMVDKSNLAPRYFRKYQSERIVIGTGCAIKADGKLYTTGIYVLAF